MDPDDLLRRLDGGPCDLCGEAMEALTGPDRAMLETAIESGQVVRVDRICDDCGIMQPGWSNADS